MVPWWVVNLSWQNGSNKTNQLCETFKLKGLVILGNRVSKQETKTKSMKPSGVFFFKIKRIDKALCRLSKKIREKAQMNNNNNNKNPKR